MIINLTQHKATPDQVKAGVVDLPDEDRKVLTDLLTVQMGGEGGFASVSREGQAFELEYRAGEIVSRFVVPLQVKRAEKLARTCEQAGIPASGADALTEAQHVFRVECMVGGFEPLTRAIRRRLEAVGAVALTALSDRVTVEEPLPDGTVKKTQVFKHLGFTDL